MNEKIRLMGFLVLAAVILLIGCATTSIGPVNGAYPKTPDGQCKINSNFTIGTFDGVTADWPGGDDIVIPAGTHALKLVVSRQLKVRDSSYTRSERRGDTVYTYTYSDPNRIYIPYEVIFEVTYDFQKGKSYIISGNSSIYYDRENQTIVVAKDTELVFHEDNRGLLESLTLKPKIEVSESSSSSGSLFVTPEATGLVGAGLAYGGVTIGQFGERFGIGILGGKMDLKLVGLGQVGMLIPFSGGLPGLQYNFGGLLEYHFPKIGIGAGGGMSGSLLAYEVKNEYGNADGTRWEHELWPYVELNMSIRKNINRRHHVIYFHYYPSWGEEWYKTFGFGYKCNLIN